MAKSARSFNTSCITMNPSFFLHLISVSPFSTPKKTSRNRHQPSLPLIFFLSLWSLSALLGICSLAFYTLSHSPIACSSSSPLLFASLSSVFHDSTMPLPPQGPPPNNPNISAAEREFWSQPDSQGYRPCLRFSLDYRRSSAKISEERRRFLVVFVSGGLNQQRNQIVDAVVIARILEAALVVPVLQVNRIWGDESEFSEIWSISRKLCNLMFVLCHHSCCNHKLKNEKRSSARNTCSFMCTTYIPAGCRVSVEM